MGLVALRASQPGQSHRKLDDIVCHGHRADELLQFEEPRPVDDLRGLCKTRPLLGWIMVVSALSLLGLPPLLGFFAKLPLFSSAISAGEITLVLVLGLNSAAAAFYYLRLVYAPMLGEPDPEVEPYEINPFWARRWAAVASAGGVLVFAIAANAPIGWSEWAATYEPAHAGQVGLQEDATPDEHRDDGHH